MVKVVSPVVESTTNSANSALIRRFSHEPDVKAEDNMAEIIIQMSAVTIAAKVSMLFQKTIEVFFQLCDLISEV